MVGLCINGGIFNVGMYVIVNVWMCMCYGKYQEGIMKAPKRQNPLGAIIIAEGYSRNAYVPVS